MPVLSDCLCLGLICQAGSCDKSAERRGAETELETNLISDYVSSIGGSVPGIPGEDYPVLAAPPDTAFTCEGKVNGGYYADAEARCQGVLSVISCQAHSSLISVAAFHICAGEGDLVKFSFLCPNGTLFNQQYFVCDWWFNVDCAATEQFYSLNDELDTARQSSSLSAQGEYDTEAQVGINKNV